MAGFLGSRYFLMLSLDLVTAHVVCLLLLTELTSYKES